MLLELNWYPSNLSLSYIFFQMSQPVSCSSFAHVLLASNSLLVQVLQIEHPVVTPQSFIAHPSYSPIEHWVHRPIFFLLPNSLLRGCFPDALHLDLISVTASLWPNSVIIQPNYGFIKICHNNWVSPVMNIAVCMMVLLKHLPIMISGSGVPDLLLRKNE